MNKDLIEPSDTLKQDLFKKVKEMVPHAGKMIDKLIERNEIESQFCASFRTKLFLELLESSLIFIHRQSPSVAIEVLKHVNQELTTLELHLKTTYTKGDIK